MKISKFSAIELSELESLEILGGAITPLLAQPYCTNAADGCGFGADQTYCTNKSSNCGCPPKASESSTNYDISAQAPQTCHR